MLIDLFIGLVIGKIFIDYCTPLREWTKETAEYSANILWELWIFYKWR